MEERQGGATMKAMAPAELLTGGGRRQRWGTGATSGKGLPDGTLADVGQGGVAWLAGIGIPPSGACVIGGGKRGEGEGVEREEDGGRQRWWEKKGIEGRGRSRLGLELVGVGWAYGPAREVCLPRCGRPRWAGARVA